MTNELNKLAFRLMDLRERIEKVIDWKDQVIQSEGWAKEYDQILANVIKYCPEKMKQDIENNYKLVNVPFAMISRVLPKFEKLTQEPKAQLSQKILSESYKLLLDISNDFYKTQDKKLETLRQRAEAERRRAVADSKEEGRRIEDTDKARKSGP